MGLTELMQHRELKRKLESFDWMSVLQTAPLPDHPNKGEANGSDLLDDSLMNAGHSPDHLEIDVGVKIFSKPKGKNRVDSLQCWTGANGRFVWIGRQSCLRNE